MSQPTTPAPVKPARSPVERGIVWGVIAIGLIVIAVEFSAYFFHALALGKLQAQLKANSEKDVGITKKDVLKVVGRKTPEQKKLGPFETAMGADRVEIYSYSGWLKSRPLFVYYGISGKTKDQEPEVMEVSTVPAESAAEALAKIPKPDPNAKANPVPAGMPGMPAMGGPPGGGPGRGGPGGPGGPGGAPGAGPPAAEGADAAKKEADKPADEKPGTEEKPAADEKPADENKPAEEKKPEADAKPAETEKPAEEAKPADAKPETDKPAEPEPKKE